MLRGAFSIFGRDLIVLRRSLFSELLAVVASPLTLYLAFGFGLKGYISAVDGVPYAVFIAPGLISMTAVLAAFEESAWSMWFHRRVQKTIEEYRVTPITVYDIVVGKLISGFAQGGYQGGGGGRRHLHPHPVPLSPPEPGGLSPLHRPRLHDLFLPRHHLRHGHRQAGKHRPDPGGGHHAAHLHVRHLLPPLLLPVLRPPRHRPSPHHRPLRRGPPALLPAPPGRSTWRSSRSRRRPCSCWRWSIFNRKIEE